VCVLFRGWWLIRFCSLELRNVDRKINFLVQSRLQKDARKEERDKETWFEFFDQSASQDNPLGLKKSVCFGVVWCFFFFCT